MIELKSEPTVARDEVTSAAGALKERLNVLSELNFEDQALTRAVGEARNALASALEALLECRRRAGELPDAGQREKAQFGAVGLRVKTLFSEDTEAQVVAESLLEHCDDLLVKVAAAQRFAGEHPALDRALEDLESAAGQARSAFRALA